MRVEDILRSKGRHVDTIIPSATVEEAIQRLRARQIGALVVSVDGYSVDSLLSERDITIGLSKHGARLLHLMVGVVASFPVVTCKPDDNLGTVMAEMTNRRIRHLPVVEQGRLAGLISIGDVVKARLEELEYETKLMREAYIVRH